MVPVFPMDLLTRADAQNLKPFAVLVWAVGRLWRKGKEHLISGVQGQPRVRSATVTPKLEKQNSQAS